MKYNAKSFLDLLFNCLLGFVFLFITSIALVNVENKKANIETKAEYVITVTWDVDNECDIDSWLLDPGGNFIWFNNKEAGLAHLDRDDIGAITDKFVLPDGTEVVYPYNQEIITIRQTVPGIWAFNLHMYNKREVGGARVVVKMEKLNPTVKTIFIEEYTLTEFGEEVTVARWELGIDGEVKWMDKVPVDMVANKLTSRPSTRERRGGD